MIIFIYGEDTYRSRQRLRKISENYKRVNKSGLDLIFFEGLDFNFNDFKNVFSQTSMFNEKKLVIVSDFFSNQAFKDSFLENIKLFAESKDIVLFYERIKILEKDPFLKKIKKLAKIENFEPLEGEKLKKWAKENISNLDIEIQSEALAKMIDFIGNNLWQFSNEIKKLANYRKQGIIRVEDVELLIRPRVETAIFKTIDAVAQKNKRKALVMIHQHLNLGDSPGYLLAMINYQLRNLLIVKDLAEKNEPYYSILKKTGLNHFVLKKSHSQAERFTFQELKKTYRKAFQIDLDIKTGKIKPETALDLFIAGI